MMQLPAVRVVAEVGKLLEQALDGFSGVEPAEIVGAEVCIHDPVG